MTGCTLIFALLTTLPDVESACHRSFIAPEPFEVKGLVVSAGTNDVENMSYLLAEGDDRLTLACTNGIAVPAGSVVIARGHVGQERNGWLRAYATDFSVIGHAPVPLPVEISSRRLSDPSLRGHIVTLTATVIDIVPDDIDPRYERLVLRDKDSVFHAAAGKLSAKRREDLIGATIALTGTPSFPNGGKRRFFTPALSGGFSVLRPAPADRFDAPELEPVEFTSAQTIYEMGRRRASGIVLASWRPRHVLLRADSGRVIRADLADDIALPTAGTRITALGFPETDLFNINLARTHYKIEVGTNTVDTIPLSVAATDIFAGEFGPNEIQPQFHGRHIRIRGTVSNQPKAAFESGMFELSCGEYRLNVNAENCREAVSSLKPDCKVEITGICVLNTRNWLPGDIFPRIDGLTVVVRNASDIRILCQPPWWTVGKLFAVIGGLLAALLGILLWNRFLQRVIRRRSTELARMELAKATADLQIGERTRLAVDIHDSLSQTLTGVSFQIDAAEKTVGTDDAAALNFLVIARRTLASCREELRRCLWDLRNNTIGEPNFGKAVELVLQPHAKAAKITVRFNLPRAALTDSIAHDILSIIRELTVNAIRHGKAAHVRIAGERREGVIRFSVTDDGIGFDPEQRPGVDEGHFGLQGVRERLNRLGKGTFNITSTPGKGTKVIVEIGK